MRRSSPLPPRSQPRGPPQPAAANPSCRVRWQSTERRSKPQRNRRSRPPGARGCANPESHQQASAAAPACAPVGLASPFRIGPSSAGAFPNGRRDVLLFGSSVQSSVQSSRSVGRNRSGLRPMCVEKSAVLQAARTLQRAWTLRDTINAWSTHDERRCVGLQLAGQTNLSIIETLPVASVLLICSCLFARCVDYVTFTWKKGCHWGPYGQCQARVRSKFRQRLASRLRNSWHCNTFNRNMVARVGHVILPVTWQDGKAGGNR